MPLLYYRVLTTLKRNLNADGAEVHICKSNPSKLSRDVTLRCSQKHILAKKAKNRKNPHTVGVNSQHPPRELSDEYMRVFLPPNGAEIAPMSHLTPLNETQVAFASKVPRSTELWRWLRNGRISDSDIFVLIQITTMYFPVALAVPDRTDIGTVDIKTEQILESLARKKISKLTGKLIGLLFPSKFSHIKNSKKSLLSPSKLNAAWINKYPSFVNALSSKCGYGPGGASVVDVSSYDFYLVFFLCVFFAVTV